MNTVIVVTRYGGLRHLAEGGQQQDDGRFLTLCRGTSSWTLTSWERFPDHPVLTPAEMKHLPICSMCVRLAAGLRAQMVEVAPDPEPEVEDGRAPEVLNDEPQPEAVTDQSQHRFVAVISRRTVGWVEKAVGPFDTEAAAQAWLDSMGKPGGVVPMVVLS
jgi:hypothetical protein